MVTNNSDQRGPCSVNPDLSPQGLFEYTVRLTGSSPLSLQLASQGLSHTLNLFLTFHSAFLLWFE